MKREWQINRYEEREKDRQTLYEESVRDRYEKNVTDFNCREINRKLFILVMFFLYTHC